jgi:hypothetical protein
MAEKYLVRAVHREGYPGAWRAGRLWSSTDSTLIEVVDGPDPEIDAPVEKGERPRKMLDPQRVGRASFELLKLD